MSLNPQRLSRRSLLRASSFGLAASPILSLLSPELVPSAYASELATLPRGDEAHASHKDFPIRILFNENPLGCSPRARTALKVISTRTQFYPMELASQLKQVLRKKHGMSSLGMADNLQVRPELDEGEHSLVIGCGSTEILNAAAMAYSMEGGNIVEPAPSYQAIGRKAISRPGSTMERRRVPLSDSGAFDVDELIAACDSKTRLMVVTNPNNPTGNALSLRDLTELIKRVPSHVLVFVDEAYIDFLEDPESKSALPMALERDNILVARTFSKIHGLAALRCGYGVAHREIWTRLEPFMMGMLGLNACGLAAALASLSDDEFQASSRLMAAASRKMISQFLPTLGFEVTTSQGACIWANWGRDTTQLVETLAKNGVLIASGNRWNEPNCVRISVGTKWQTTQLLDKISSAIEKL